MIDKDKLKEWMTSQLGTLDKARLDDSEETDLKSRVIPLARMEDICTRMIHQIAMNAAQSLFQAGGISVARPLKTKTLLHKMTSWLRNSPKMKGSVVEGLGKEGYAPIAMGDLGFFGFGHPRQLGCRTRFQGANGVRTNRISISGRKDGKKLEFSQVIKQFDPETEDEGSEDQYYKWKDEIQAYPGPNYTSEDWIGRNYTTTNDAYVFRWRVKPEENEDEEEEGEPPPYVHGSQAQGLGGWLFAAGLTGAQVTEIRRMICDAEDDISPSFISGETSAMSLNSINDPDEPPEHTYSSEAIDLALHHKTEDYSGEAVEKFNDIMEVRILPLAGRAPLATRSYVTPGNNLTIPRVSPATVGRPIPNKFRTICESGQPELASTDMKTYVNTTIASIDAYVQANASPDSQTQVRLKQEIRDKSKKVKSCMSLSMAIIEGFLFSNNVREHVESYAYETNDNAPRKSVKKYSRRNK